MTRSNILSILSNIGTRFFFRYNTRAMRIKNAFIVLSLGVVLLSFAQPARASQDGAPPQPKEEFAPGELIVIMKPGKQLRELTLPEQAKASPRARKGLEKLNAGLIQVPPGEESAYIEKLKKNKDVLAVEPNYRAYAEMIPNDPDYPLQYAPAAIQAVSAWDVTFGSPSVVIAVIDSGIDATHPEFAGRVLPGYDFVQDDSTPQDECGHGTHVAGIAAAAGNNAQGVAGIAWGVNVLPLRVLNSVCDGYYADIADAFVYAADHGAQVINASLGGYSPSILLENAANYAYTRGAAIFAAAGNIPALGLAYPARYDSVMAVGAVDSANLRAPTSSYGADLDLMAPGVNIYSTTPFNPAYNVFYGTTPQYSYLSGTSMAAPHASGAAALLLSMNNGCFQSPLALYQALRNSALDLGALGFDNEYGYGLIQIRAAMNLCPAPTLPVEYDLIRSDRCPALVSYNWVDASGGAIYLLPNSGYQNFPLPFSFNFGGAAYNSINVHSNGFVSLGNNNAESFDGNYQTNKELPYASKPNHFIAAFWDDLTSIGGGGAAYVQTFGAAPNRQTVIEYRDVNRYGLPSTNLNFEIILYEGSDQIKLQYRSLSGAGADGSSATVGLEYGMASLTGHAGYQYSYNQAGALYNGLALLFAPYSYGQPTLPSDAVCPQTLAETVQPASGFACSPAPETFSVEIAPGALSYQSALKIQQMASAPAMPGAYLDLRHYADVNFRYSPPAPTLYPAPPVYVCYAYSAQDLLTAGGHAENLFIAAHNARTGKWSALPTTVDTLNARLLALAPHFSFYGVATLNPREGEALGLPATGAALDSRLFSPAAWILLTGLAVSLWLAKARRR